MNGMSSFQMVKFHLLCYSYGKSFYDGRTNNESPSKFDVVSHNIGVVVAIWAPIVLVSRRNSVKTLFTTVLNVENLHYFMVYRFTLWMRKFGMLYFLPFSVGFMEPSAVWVRSAAIFS